MKKVILASWIIGLCLALLVRCESSEDENAKIQIWLTDAPGDFEEVNIDLKNVEVHVGDDSEESGWRSLAVNAGVYNLLDLTNGLDTLLGEIELPAGKISQIRLKLGSDNSIKVSGEIFDLSTPSAQQSGLKLLVNQTLEPGVTYKVLLDFDVARSIVLTGNGSYKLKPVIRTITEAIDGAIKGVVDPKESSPAVYAIIGLDTLGTTYSDSTGHFLIRGLKAGSYSVSFQPATNYLPVLKEGVQVTLGTVTDLDTVKIAQ